MEYVGVVKNDCGFECGLPLDACGMTSSMQRAQRSRFEVRVSVAVIPVKDGPWSLIPDVNPLVVARRTTESADGCLTRQTYLRRPVCACGMDNSIHAHKFIKLAADKYWCPLCSSTSFPTSFSRHVSTTTHIDAQAAWDDTSPDKVHHLYPPRTKRGLFAWKTGGVDPHAVPGGVELLRQWVQAQGRPLPRLAKYLPQLIRPVDSQADDSRGAGEGGAHAGHIGAGSASGQVGPAANGLEPAAQPDSKRNTGDERTEGVEGLQLQGGAGAGCHNPSSGGGAGSPLPGPPAVPPVEQEDAAKPSQRKRRYDWRGRIPVKISYDGTHDTAFNPANQPAIRLDAQPAEPPSVEDDAPEEGPVPAYVMEDELLEACNNTLDAYLLDGVGNPPDPVGFLPLLPACM